MGNKALGIRGTSPHLVYKQLEWWASLSLPSSPLASFSLCLSAKSTLGMRYDSHGCSDSSCALNQAVCNHQDPGRLSLRGADWRMPTALSMTHSGKGLLKHQGGL